MSKNTLMRLVLVVALVLGVAQLGSAQRDREPTPAGGAVSAEAQQKSSADAQAKNNAASLRSGTKIQAELESALNTRAAKPGDEVAARVTKDVKQNGQVVLRKGDRLLGRVTEVQSAASADGASRLGVAFDRVVQGEATSELHAVIRSVLSIPSQERARDEEMRRRHESAPMAPAPRPAATASGATSAAGGVVGGVTSTAGSVVGGATSTVDSTVGGAASSTVRGTGATVDAATGTQVGSSTGTMVSTPISNIRVQSNAQAENQTSAGSVLSTRRGDLHLESGTRLQLQTVAQAEAGKQ
ncbi:MAG: hypothetical protein ACRD4U_01475 [Candidatus Acidiferrales bacterium]